VCVLESNQRFDKSHEAYSGPKRVTEGSQKGYSDLVPQNLHVLFALCPGTLLIEVCVCACVCVCVGVCACVCVCVCVCDKAPK
jgi:hypothetical protein